MQQRCNGMRGCENPDNHGKHVFMRRLIDDDFQLMNTFVNGGVIGREVANGYTQRFWRNEVL